MPSHLIAVDTYGAQRVRAPASGAMLSAYKIGYTTIGRDVLLSLYGNQALDVTPKQASYHYVSISGATSVHNGYLLFSLTDEELAKVERYTRYHPSSRSGCWRWLDGKWQKFPTSANSEYLAAIGREGPNFDPNRYRPVSPSTGTKVEASEEIRAEKSQRDAQKTWWWLTGNTYPHKDLLKRLGCRWSKGRRSWYFIGEDLPEAVKKLVTVWGDAEESTSSSEELATDASFKEGETVYYIGKLEQMSKSGKPIRSGDAGQVLMLAANQVLVNFEAGNAMMHGSELSHEAPVPAIQATLPDEEKFEPIRVIKPELSETDPLYTAIQASKDKPLPVSLIRTNSSHKLAEIGQKYVGELTGSISGNVFCYGYAVHQDVMLYLNLGGPRMAVEAIRARLAKGEVVNLVPWDAPAIELSAGETDGRANTGIYTAYLNSISEAKFTSAILLHECLTLPNYGGKSITGIFRTSEEQTIAKLLHHVRQLLNIPVFDTWAGYLYQAGQSAGLLRKPRSDGEIDLLVLDLDETAWTRLITGGLANSVIQLPVNTD